MNNTQAGYERGQARGRRNALAALMGQAFTAPESQRAQLYGNIAQVGGADEAASVQKAIAGFDDARHQEFGRMVATFSALPREQKAVQYPAFAQRAQSDFGIPVPQGQYQDSYDDGMRRIALAFGSGNGIPSGYQEFDLLASDANLSPEDRAKAARTRLNLDRKPSSAAIKYMVVEGPDHRKRVVAMDPNQAGAQVVGSGESYGAGVGAGALAGGGVSAAPSPGNADQVASVAQSMLDSGIPPEMIDRWVASRADAIAAPTTPNLLVSGTPGEEAFDRETGTQQARINALPTIGGIEAQNAGAKERAVATVQAQTSAGIEAAKQFGQDAGKAFTALQESGRAGVKERTRLSLLRADLQKTYTGPGANVALGIKRVANAFGVKVDGLAEGEAARALSNQLALSLRNPAGGEGMPGAMSNSDREFLRQSVPSLENSPQGWRAMVDMRLALADAAVKQAQYAEQLRRQGVPIQDIPGKVQDFANQNPVFHVHDTAARRKALLEKY